MIPRRDARRRQQVRRRKEPARRRPRFRPDPARRRASPFASARRSRVPLIFTDVFPARPSSRPLELANQARRNLFASPPRVVSRRAAFEPPSRSSLRSRVAVRSAARGRRRRHRSRRATPSRRRRRRRRRRRSHRASSFASRVVRIARRRVVSRTRIRACAPDRASFARAALFDAPMAVASPSRAVARARRGGAARPRSRLRVTHGLRMKRDCVSHTDDGIRSDGRRARARTRRRGLGAEHGASDDERTRANVRTWWRRRGRRRGR